MEGRRQEMIDLVNREGEVSFNQLKEHFPDVSEVTLRKDLRILDAGQHLIRIYGGAKSIRSTYTNMTSYYMRNTQHMEEKQQIARKAVKLLKPYDSLYLAAGSTCCAIAQNLPDIPLRIITDGLETALALSKQKKAESLILISHQERIIKMADRIMVIENGTIGAVGPRDEILPRLLDKGGSCTCMNRE